MGYSNKFVLVLEIKAQWQHNKHNSIKATISSKIVAFKKILMRLDKTEKKSSEHIKNNVLMELVIASSLGLFIIWFMHYAKASQLIEKKSSEHIKNNVLMELVIASSLGLFIIWFMHYAKASQLK
ncbi:hypothetical protein DICVIV_11713 [Dictyocaulus viviparus]|uniref:Uncharacterized protein n=1 Tax=Dictyocaulus viviparus TaxID=29172 RepID=A0A0D8XF29_DICVI|nr:hypothetical protein DICVIV_11713 [Dictyocaulus viviparus]